jgi:hypothetical protein
MPALTLKSGGGILRQLVTDCNIHIPPGTHTKPCSIKAIWDTGATGSAITTIVVKQLGLIPTGKVQLGTANGIITQNTYTIDIGLPGNVLIQSVIASEVSALISGCDALIGMDIITLGDLSITNHKGVTCMSFRLPSAHEIDYVKNPNYGETPIKHIPAGQSGSKFTPKKKKRK